MCLQGVPRQGSPTPRNGSFSHLPLQSKFPKIPPNPLEKFSVHFDSSWTSPELFIYSPRSIAQLQNGIEHFTTVPHAFPTAAGREKPESAWESETCGSPCCARRREAAGRVRRELAISFLPPILRGLRGAGRAGTAAGARVPRPFLRIRLEEPA